tara:strand:- start:1148 stop:1849 length:702 start_codon:yes stop_codon:yes gene_type:complete
MNSQEKQLEIFEHNMKREFDFQDESIGNFYIKSKYQKRNCDVEMNISEDQFDEMISFQEFMLEVISHCVRKTRTVYGLGYYNVLQNYCKGDESKLHNYGTRFRVFNHDYVCMKHYHLNKNLDVSLRKGFNVHRIDDWYEIVKGNETTRGSYNKDTRFYDIKKNREKIISEDFPQFFCNWKPEELKHFKDRELYRLFCGVKYTFEWVSPPKMMIEEWGSKRKTRVEDYLQEVSS